MLTFKINIEQLWYNIEITWISSVLLASFFSVPGSSLASHIALSRHVSLVSVLWQFCSLSLSLMTLIFLKSPGQVFCRMSLNFKFVWCFLMIRPWLCVIRKDSTALMSPSQCIVLICYLVHLVKVVSARILHCKVTIFLFLIIKYLGREGTFPEGKVPSPCLFVCLYQYATWIFISVLLLLCMLLFKLPQLWPVGIQVASCAFRQVSISTSPRPCTASFFNFLTPWDYPSASYIFTAPALGSTSFPKSLGSFYWG